jgi:DNA repair protein RecN (Recombination protein N)
MLAELRVRDLATVADVTLTLGPGLNVLTGETGAGKSMLVDAIALLLGDRGDRAAVRPGANRIVVEGEFRGTAAALAAQLDQAGLDAADPLVIRREVSAEGRSRAWVNGSPTTITVLKEIAALLVDLHGQHQTLDLAVGSVQRDLLDAHADAAGARATVATANRAAVALREEVSSLVARRDAALRRADWLRHVVAEIDAARPVIGEDETLARDSSRLAQANTLGEEARELAHLLDAERTGLRDQLARAARVIEHLERLDPPVGAWRGMLDTAWTNLDELSRTVAGYLDSVTDDPDRLATLERRRDLLSTLSRKHGGSIAAMLDVRREAAAELYLIDTATIDLAALQRRQAAADAALLSAAGELTALRQAGAERLAGEVTRQLPGLGLAGARFVVSLVPRVEPDLDGLESVQFEAALNAGMSVRPIASAASGGELSRLMLALKVAVTRHDTAATLVFDEIDQGIGGETGGKVGAALAEVAVRHQVLVITHLPQIAARADRHLVVAKGTRDGIATSDVSVLHGEDRVVELARMLGDADDANARRLAASMAKRG